MASSGERAVNYGRRFFWFALAIVLAIALYTAGWFFVAGRLVDQVNSSVAHVNGNGRRATCENAHARGYPFRIGVFCDMVMYEDAAAGIRFRARELRSAAQVYQPTRIIVELDGAASLELPGIDALDLAWSSMRASVRLASPTPERISVEGRDVQIRRDEPGDVSPLLARAASLEGHMRTAEGGRDLAMRFSDLKLDAELTGTSAVPPLTGLADVFVEGTGNSLRGQSGELRSVSVSIGDDAGVSVSGPFSVDDDGLIDAQLRVTMRNPRALAALLVELMPDARRQIELSFSGLAALGEAPTLPLRIIGSEVRFGFLRLGAIPPL